MDRHSHADPVVCLPLGGAYVEQTRGRQTEHRLGDILLCPAGEEHSQVFPAGRVTKLLITPSAGTIDYLGDFLRVQDAPYGRAPLFGALALRLAAEIPEADVQSRLIAEGLVLQILGQFARAEDSEASPAGWLRSARDYVSAHACMPLRLDDVADFVGRRPPQLAAAYRRAFGCTIGEDARALRLQRAAQLLASTAEPIAGIAAECGYYDQAHFSRLFRKAFGMTPLAYRRRLH